MEDLGQWQRSLSCHPEEKEYPQVVREVQSRADKQENDHRLNRFECVSNK